MIFFILVALATLPIYLIISTYLAYKQNISLAQDLGLPYIAIRKSPQPMVRKESRYMAELLSLSNFYE